MLTTEITLHHTGDGRTELALPTVGDEVWMTQAQMAELFGTTPQAITRLIGMIYRSGELSESATINSKLIVQTEGDRRVQRRVKHYNLDLVLAVGYRVRSPRGKQFRAWANATLREYLVKGFAINDRRLKNPAGGNLDELVERMQAIRASDARLRQQLHDLLALSEDYDPGVHDLQALGAALQNKLLYAVTESTTAELIAARSDPDESNMGLRTWRSANHGLPLQKKDVVFARNYLDEEEAKQFNRLVHCFLCSAELRVQQGRTLRLTTWNQVLDNVLDITGLPQLHGPGDVLAAEAMQLATERYAIFDARRRARKKARANAPPHNDLTELRRIAEATENGGNTDLS